jgi:hypothetical protein
MQTTAPGLFGLKNSNRDFSQHEEWGKNKFNSSFPAALCCYMESKGVPAVYLKVEEQFSVGTIPISDLFNLGDAQSRFFAFESQYTPYQRMVIGELPRTDLVIQNNGACVRSLEIKLTALPDNTTCDQKEIDYGCEIVVRPDTIAYLVCSLKESLPYDYKFQDSLKNIDFEDEKSVLTSITSILKYLKDIVELTKQRQVPFLIQPIWKTNGKSPTLSNNCLDVFVWSNTAFLEFAIANAEASVGSNSINRQTRTAVWVFIMIRELFDKSRFNHAGIIDRFTYNTKNDKAFASSGAVTNKYMKCERLVSPVISKNEIKNIILGGGQKYLSPERRFDAIIYNSPDLF